MFGMICYLCLVRPPCPFGHQEELQEQQLLKEQQQLQELQLQQERIEELEEALRESVRITAQREVAVAQKQYIIEAANDKVKYCFPKIAIAEYAPKYRGCVRCGVYRNY